MSGDTDTDRYTAHVHSIATLLNRRLDIELFRQIPPQRPSNIHTKGQSNKDVIVPADYVTRCPNNGVVKRVLDKEPDTSEMN